MIKLINPKHSYIAGTLVSAFHFQKVTQCEVYQYESSSEFLSELGIPQKPFHEEQFISELKPDDIVVFNDTAIDTGFESDWEANKFYLQTIQRVAEASKNYVLVINHTPFGRQGIYNELVFKILGSNVKLLCYRESHIEQLPALNIGGIKCHFDVLPYFYDMDLVSGIDIPVEKNIDILYMTRKSRNKPNYLVPILERLSEENLWRIKVVDSSNPIGLKEGIDLYRKSKLSISGFFHQPGSIPESDLEWNKLDWSALDSYLCGCIPVTSDLFAAELDRLNLSSIQLPYRNPERFPESLLEEMIKLKLQYHETLIESNKASILNYLNPSNEFFSDNLLRLSIHPKFEASSETL